MVVQKRLAPGGRSIGRVLGEHLEPVDGPIGGHVVVGGLRVAGAGGVDLARAVGLFKQGGGRCALYVCSPTG